MKHLVIIMALVLPLAMSTGCAASNPATVTTPTAPVDPLLTISTALAKIQQSNQQLATVVIEANAAKLIPDDTARAILAISLKVSQGGDQAAAVIQGLSALPAGTKLTLWNVLGPVSTAVNNSLATGLIPITDANTKAAVQGFLTTIQATLAVVQVQTGN